MAVTSEVLTGVDGARIGIATLDAAKSLNALSLAMIEQLEALRVAFLAADDAGFITGATISANGGQFFV